jgi:hypothetical protein
MIDEGREVTSLRDVNLPVEDGVYSFFMSYNGEPAFLIVIENMPGEITPGVDPRKIVAAKFHVHTMPIGGGKGVQANLKLMMEGPEFDSNA